MDDIYSAADIPPDLRQYFVRGELGLEETPDEYVAKMVEVFREVRRVLRDDGTLWLNLGDSYAANKGAGYYRNQCGGLKDGPQGKALRSQEFDVGLPDGLKPKDLVGIPWRVAFALQADGWWLRQDIIWQKPNPMPESVRDRCTKAHEYIFLLSKSARYFYDADAIAEEATGLPPGNVTHRGATAYENGDRFHRTKVGLAAIGEVDTRNRRSVWSITTKPFSEAHFATFPPDLPELCIKAATSEHGVCGECGAPWERVIEKSGASNASNEVIVTSGVPGLAAGSSHDRVRKLSGSTYEKINNPTDTWTPTCECGSDPRPATVLDPFGGAGTTGLVADRLNRDAILVELNPEYAKMAERRIYGDAPMFVEVTVEMPDQEAA